MTDGLTVSVIVPSRNVASVLGGQLKALSRQTFNGFLEVIVVDNGSTDNTVEVAAEWANKLPRMRVVNADLRTGASYARNTGVKAASGDLVLFCDADDEVDSGWVHAMVEGLKRADVVGGPLSLDLLNPPHIRAWRRGPTADALPVPMGYLPYAIGANVGVWKKVYEALNGFNEAYVTSHDDVDFCWRAQQESYRLGYQPEAVVHYRLRPTLMRLAKQRYGYGQSSAQLFREHRHHGIAAGSIGAELKTWSRLLRRTPQLAYPAGRGQWVFSASWHLGRLRGSLSQRVLCP